MDGPWSDSRRGDNGKRNRLVGGVNVTPGCWVSASDGHVVVGGSNEEKEPRKQEDENRISQWEGKTRER
jgi:hypothetical protein